MKNDLELQYELVPEWPVLAWLAKCERANSIVTVFHGQNVETHSDWFGEVVWDSEFAEANFDQTDIVNGSGGRVREGKFIFVSPGSTVDRLSSIEVRGVVWVSNSLACMLTAVDGNVDPTYRKYYSDLKSISKGLKEYRRFLETNAGKVEFTYFNNLLWDGEALTTKAKPWIERDFSTFSTYKEFLETAMGSLARNMSDASRVFPYTFLGTLSSGYDSATIATLARSFGCREVICFDKARGGDHDSGVPLAERLCITPLSVRQEAWRTLIHPEVPFLAGDAQAVNVIFSGAGNLLSGRVLLTGFLGDKVWGKSPGDVSENIVRSDQAGLDLTEYRLQKGFIHCPVPFWGIRQIADVHRISLSDELKPWDIAGDYSRPICRRIVEEAGVSREMFGTKKKASADLFTISDLFLTPRSMEDFLQWLETNRQEWKRRGRRLPIKNQRLDQWTQFGRNKIRSISVQQRFIWRLADFIDETETPLRSALFPWALDRTKRLYECACDF
jgi:hypothetical protein